MSRESIVRWAENIANRKPHPGYCTGTRRFGPDCYDCSGFTYMAYLSDRKVIPADSSLVARWGRTNGQVGPVASARLADLVIHDKYGDPYNSSGPRGHIGLVDHVAGNRVITWESSGTGHGVAPQNRPVDFWAIRVQHPAFAGTAPAPTPQPQEDDLTPEEHNWLHGIAMLVAKHDDMLGWISAALIEGGYEKRAPETLRLPKVQTDTQAIRKTLGA